MQTGDFDGALEPLLSAVRLDTGPERGSPARALLVQALEGLVEIRTAVIDGLSERGNRDAAVAECELLWTILTRACEAGMSQDDLAAVFSKARRLFASLDVRG